MTQRPRPQCRLVGSRSLSAAAPSWSISFAGEAVGLQPSLPLLPLASWQQPPPLQIRATLCLAVHVCLLEGSTEQSGEEPEVPRGEVMEGGFSFPLAAPQLQPLGSCPQFRLLPKGPLWWGGFVAAPQRAGCWHLFGKHCRGYVWQEGGGNPGPGIAGSLSGRSGRSEQPYR